MKNRMTEFMYNRIFLLSSPVGCMSLCNIISLLICHCNDSCRLRHKISIVSKKYYLYNKIKQDITTQHNMHCTQAAASCVRQGQLWRIVKVCW